MIVKEHVLLSSLTTLRVGGAAQYVLECETTADIVEALAFIRERSLPYMVLGQGSNVLADDSEYDGVILAIRGGDMLIEPGYIIADAGVSWDALVTRACENGLWGIENLAGIPGTVGASPVQNVGAYGIEVGDSIEWVEALEVGTSTLARYSNTECEFAYRDSVFKREGGRVITRVAFRVSMDGTSKLGYKDLAAAKEQGIALETPAQIADAVRTIRARKFPDLNEFGTAGSFFKNPILSSEQFEHVHALYPELPAYPDPKGTKVSLAWILDNALSMKGYGHDCVRLFERQPLVLVTDSCATAHDVNVVAEEVEARVFEATSIRIEREVRTVTKNKI